jgi:hypothetical protein
VQVVCPSCRVGAPAHRSPCSMPRVWATQAAPAATPSAAPAAASYAAVDCVAAAAAAASYDTRMQLPTVLPQCRRCCCQFASASEAAVAHLSEDLTGQSSHAMIHHIRDTRYAHPGHMSPTAYMIAPAQWPSSMLTASMPLPHLATRAALSSPRLHSLLPPWCCASAVRACPGVQLAERLGQLSAGNLVWMRAICGDRCHRSTRVKWEQHVCQQSWCLRLAHSAVMDASNVPALATLEFPVPSTPQRLGHFFLGSCQLAAACFVLHRRDMLVVC